MKVLDRREGTEMLSFGAGVNSAAMAILLIREGWRGLIVFADTGADHPNTYAYLDYFQTAYLDAHGLAITRLSPATHPHLYPPSYRMDLIAKCRSKDIVPIVLNRWCTAEYKRNPLTKYGHAQGVTAHLLGIAADEAKRAQRQFDRVRVPIKYPLVERAIDRAACIELIAAAGLQVPAKSGCWLCPFQRIGQWRALYHDHPDLFALALELDNAAMAKMLATRAVPFKGQLTMGHRRPLSAFADMFANEIHQTGQRFL